MVKLRSHTDAQGTANPVRPIPGKRRRTLVLTGLPVIAIIALLATPAGRADDPAALHQARVPGHASTAAMPAHGARHVSLSGFEIRRTSSDTFELVNGNSNLCLGISGGKHNADAVQWGCNGPPDQQWQWQENCDTGTEYCELQDDNGQQCLGVAGGSTTKGAHIVGWNCLSHADQYWFAFTEGGPMQIENFNSQMMVGVSGGSKSWGAYVVQWPITTAINQLWSYSP